MEDIRVIDRIGSPREPKEEAIEKKDHSRTYIKVLMVALVTLTIYGLMTFNSKSLDLGKAVGETLHNLRVIFLEPALKTLTLSSALHQILITFALAFLCTFWSAILSFFLGLLAAENLTNKASSTVIKSVVSLIRSVPTVLWVLIFAVTAGLGSVAAIIGISFHAVGYLTKMFSESFESMDQGPIEALRAAGATWWQIITQAVLPITAPSLFAWTFMRFEINYMVAMAMGAAAGAGGIGFNLFMSGSFYYNMNEVGAITWLILATCLLLEFVSTRVKKKFLGA